MGADEDKATLFAQLGYADDVARLDSLLKDAGLTNPRKSRIRVDKTDQVADIIAERFFLVCNRGDCQQTAQHTRGSREIARAATPEFCEVCGGGSSQAAVDDMIDAWKRVGWSRLCVVGGSPNSRADLEKLIAGRLEIRLIDGESGRSTREAKGDMDWADRVLIWGGTQLAHKTSTPYSGPGVVLLRKRGIQHLAREAAISARTAAR